MLRALVHFSCTAAKEAHHWKPMNRHCSSEIYQKWYSAVNEKAMASPLPIHHQWCIADKLLGSNKPLLRGWPHWWKQKTPPWPSQHTQPRLLDTTVSACLCARELISTLLLLGGGVCPCTLTEKNKHTICLQTLGVRVRLCSTPALGGWSQKGYSHSAWLTCVFTRLFKQHLVSFRVDVDK